MKALLPNSGHPIGKQQVRKRDGAFFIKSFLYLLVLHFLRWKMKYKRMLCWVDKQEKTKIQQENNKFNIPIFFTKNYDEFKEEINDNSYLIISIKKAKYKKTMDIIHSFPNNKFHVLGRLDGAFTTIRESNLLEEKNVWNPKYPQFTVKTLRNYILTYTKFKRRLFIWN
ncbi:hypothetical protein R84B8_02509 [Treponema sp. R8-4-B8]